MRISAKEWVEYLSKKPLSSRDGGLQPEKAGQTNTTLATTRVREILGIRQQWMPAEVPGLLIPRMTEPAGDDGSGRIQKLNGSGNEAETICNRYWWPQSACSLTSNRQATKIIMGHSEEKQSMTPLSVTGCRLTFLSANPLAVMNRDVSKIQVPT